jgi:hypothetical protein
MSNFLGLLIVSAAAPSAEGIQVKTKKMNAMAAGSRFAPAVGVAAGLAFSNAYRRTAGQAASRGIATTAFAAGRAPIVPLTDITLAQPLAQQAMLRSNAAAFNRAAVSEQQAAEVFRKATATGKEELTFLQQIRGLGSDFLKKLVEVHKPKEDETIVKKIVNKLKEKLGVEGIILSTLAALERAFFHTKLIAKVDEWQQFFDECPDLEKWQKEKFKEQMDALNKHHSAKHLNGLFDQNFLAGLEKDISLPDYWPIKVEDLDGLIHLQEKELENQTITWAALYTTAERQEIEKREEEIERLKKELEELKEQFRLAQEALKLRTARWGDALFVADPEAELVPAEQSLELLTALATEVKDETEIEESIFGALINDAQQEIESE